MPARHRRRPTPEPTKPGRFVGRYRMAVVVLAPLLVVVPMSAWASAHTQHLQHVNHAAHPAAVTVAASATASRPNWSRSWTPPLSLLVHRTKAQFVDLHLSMHVLGSQKAVASARFKTAWVDFRALTDGPNVAQQGLSVQPEQYKLQIMHGATPASHRANCHVAGSTGHILAFGPNIDVADGHWHTITCIKFPDGAHHTEVLVIVDGVGGKPAFSQTRIGNVLPTGLVRLGGRSSTASTDSLDGWISKLSFHVV